MRVGRSTGKGNPRGSRVGVCAGMGMGSHTVHPLLIPCQTRTHAQVFPQVILQYYAHTAHAAGLPGMYSSLHLLALTHSHLHIHMIYPHTRGGTTMMTT